MAVQTTSPGWPVEATTHAYRLVVPAVERKAVRDRLGAELAPKAPGGELLVAVVELEDLAHRHDGRLVRVQPACTQQRHAPRKQARASKGQDPWESWVSTLLTTIDGSDGTSSLQLKAAPTLLFVKDSGLMGRVQVGKAVLRWRGAHRLD